jgi:glycosyltransferase involved in cell wall biosynthesis
VSPSIARVYKETYGPDFRVVRNVPFHRPEPMIDTSLQARYGDRAIILYQGALNVGRGLELVIRSLSYLDHTVLLIAGGGDIEAELKLEAKKAGLADRVVFLGRVDPERLYPITCSADVGISLEEDLGLNYRYALPNKVFDYIQARIPVLCSDLPEMKAIVEGHEVGIATSERDPEGLATILKDMIRDRKAGKWSKAVEKAAGELCWENEKGILEEMLLSVLD